MEKIKNFLEEKSKTKIKDVESIKQKLVELWIELCVNESFKENDMKINISEHNWEYFTITLDGLNKIFLKKEKVENIFHSEKIIQKTNLNIFEFFGKLFLKKNYNEKILFKEKIISFDHYLKYNKLKKELTESEFDILKIFFIEQKEFKMTKEVFNELTSIVDNKIKKS